MTRRIPLLEPLRAVAASMVVAAHLIEHWESRHALLPSLYVRDLGSLGVAIFFIICGWVIYRPYIVARRKGAAVDVPAYALRRVVRIVPAFWLALVGAVILLPDSGAQSAELLRFATFTQIYSTRSYLAGLSQAWTLDVEVLFYAVAPLVAFALLARRRPRPDRDELLVLVGFVAITLGLRLADPYSVFINGLPAYLAYFAFGMLLARVSLSTHTWVLRFSRLVGSVPGMLTLWLLAALLYCIVTVHLPAPNVGRGKIFLVPYSTPLHFFARGASAFLVVLPALGAARGRSLVSHVGRWLGERSYGIYLWHPAVIAFFLARVSNFPLFLSLTVAGTVAMATLSWGLVEHPLNSWASAVGRRRAQAAAARLSPRAALNPAGSQTTDVSLS